MASAQDEGGHVRRSISVRWLSGTVLTGVSSSLLIGGALLAAMDSPHRLVAPAAASVLTAVAGPSDFAGKSDRIDPIVQAPASRQIMQVSTRTRQDDRDLIRLRPFARISAGLSMPTETEAAAIPAYDPMAIFGEVEAETRTADVGAETDQIYGAYVNGEVSIKVVEFPLGDSEAVAPLTVATADIESIVRDASRTIASGGAAAELAIVEPDPTLDPAADPFGVLGVSIVPENVTLIARSDGGGSSPSERILYFQAGDTMNAILERAEIAEADSEAIVTSLGGIVDLAALRPGEIVRVGFAPAEIGSTPHANRVSVYDSGVHQATVARTDANAFVRADEPSPMDLAAAAGAGQPIPTGSGQMPRLYEAIYQTALDQEVPRELIPELIRIFSYEVDFQSRISAGDSIEIFHSVPENPGDAADQEILFASITLGGVTKRFYRFATADDGRVDYYDEDGNSAQKFLIRKPVTTGVLRSGFGYRRHPILGYTKLHSGTDYAAPTGTPIMAAGDGVVEEAGWSSGYGRYTVIRHANGYETAYAHQSEIAAGIVPGAHVRQGQVIGYVGSSGLSTGPHLHFEVKINGTFVDPLRIRLPEGRSLEGGMLATFEQERSRIDLLLGTGAPPATRVASAQ